MKVEKVTTATKYLHHSCSGSYNNLEMIEIFRGAMANALEKKIGAILMDVRDVVGEPPSVIQRFCLGREIAQIQRMDRVKVAVVGTEPIIDKEAFGEMVAKNRGGFGKVFADIQDAINWIQVET